MLEQTCLAARDQKPHYMDKSPHERSPATALTESYARWRSTRLGQITDTLEQRLLFELLDPIAGKTILDVGCGDGELAAELARRGAVVTGVDADPAIIAAARRRAGIEHVELRLIEAKAEALPFEDASFDRILAVATLCFVPDAARAANEMTRVLKPGGRLVIGELGRWSLWAAYRRVRGWFGHPTWRVARFWSATELRKLVEAAGLDLVETRGAVYYPPCGVAARLLAPIDPWLGRRTTLGAAFIAISATKLVERREVVNANEGEMKMPPPLPDQAGATPPAFPSESPLREARCRKGLNFYEHWILPPLLDLVMRQQQLEKYRREVVAPAQGPRARNRRRLRIELSALWRRGRDCHRD